MPDQKNCVPSVAMKLGMPTRAISTPLRKPTNTPDASAPSTASQPNWYSLNSSANTKPEKAITAGNERSISPAPITKVRPIASRISGGAVESSVV